MSDLTPEAVQAGRQKNVDDPRQMLRGLLSRLETGSGRQMLLVRLACIHFFVLFVRPQDWPGLSFIGSIRTPVILSIIVIIAWLPQMSQTWTKISKLIMFFLIFECFRGLVGKFADPSDTLVRNDFWQFQTIKDLGIQLFGLGFPLIVAARSERTMQTVFFTCALTASLLGLWGATHAGKGPGGFVGDENDICLVLVMFLPFAVILRKSFRGFVFQSVSAAAALLSVAGIIASNSRGGFLGFAVVLAFLFISSDKKGLTIVAGALAFLVAIPFIPQQYIKEITSIGTEAKEGGGTMDERIDTWKSAFRVFIDPRNTLFGVGLRNVPYWLGDYEDVERGRFVKSLAGRAMHSLYFELLPDLGLYGVVVIGGVFWISISGNHRAVRLYGRLARPLLAMSTTSKDSAKKSGSKNDKDFNDERQMLIRRLLRQSRIGRDVAKAVNVSWFGTLTAAIGVSVLYYPPVWFLACLSAAVHIHLATLESAVETLESMEQGQLDPIAA